MKKIFKNNKKFVVIMLLVAFVTINFAVLAGCSNNNKVEVFDNTYKPPIYNNSNTEKQAIIILPGILGSNLVNAKTNEPIWSGGALMNNLFMTTGRLNMNQITNYFASIMKKDENGNPLTPIKAADMKEKNPDGSPNYLRFGIIDEYRNLYNFFEKNYGKDYEVIVYQYDWTKSAKDAAKDLETFIKANKFNNNILVGHSLGGVVVDYYLTNKANQTATKGFISLGAPHYGALDALLLAFANVDMKDVTNPMDILDVMGISLEDITSMIESISGLKLEEKIPEEYIGKEIDFVLDLMTNLMEIVRTMPSLYDLLPSEEMFNDGHIMLQGKQVSYTDFINKALEIDSVKNNKHIYNLVSNLKANRDSLYIDGTFASDTLGNRTYYIAGNGKHSTITTNRVNFITKTDKTGLYIKPDTNNIKRDKSFTKKFATTEDGKQISYYEPAYVGDSMVLIKSAVLGKDFSTNANVICVEGEYDHLDLYSPVSPKEDSHFLPIMVPNEIGKTLKLAMANLTK